ncbi:6-hydroxy-D-nicotine oxidase, partial [Podospora australis]
MACKLFIHLIIITSTVHSAKPPLFPWEQSPLNSSSLDTLIQETNTANFAHHFSFDNETDTAVLDPSYLHPGYCKSFPGDSTWPTHQAWEAFNTLLDGQLIKTTPLAAPCYHNTGLYDPAKCSAITSNFSNAYLHENDPTSIFWPLFSGRTCMPTTTENSSTSANCTHGGFPVYTVNATSVRHIQLGINFARNNNLRLVIKNTGHCYLGKSSGAGALSIWTHHLNDIQFFPDLTIPGYSGPALKIAPGATVRQVYQAAEQNKVSAVGGICESVGYAGGYVAGGGHTPLSGLYGMAADHVFALQVVTADGKFVTASPEENTDLFWALRGGGGSTYGIVPVVTSIFNFTTSATVSPEQFFAGVRAYLQEFIRYTDAGTYSWWILSHDVATGVYQFRMNPFFAPNHTLESFSQLVSPWFSRLKELGIEFTPHTTLHESYYPAWASTWGADPILNGAGRIFVPGNWLLPRRNWESPKRFNETFAVIQKHSESGRILRGYHQAPRNRANADNAVNPAWRETVCFLILSGLDLQQNVLGPFKKVAPVSEGGGAYLNEANVDEPDGEWQGGWYGVENYQRLVRIKQKWDPKELFYATTAVGSEGWVVRDGGKNGIRAQDGRLCRV